MNMLEAMNECIKDTMSLRSPHTARNYRQSLNLFVDYLQSQHHLDPTALPHREIKIEHFIDFPMWIARRGYAKRTVASHLSGTGYFMNWLIVRGDLSPSYADILRWKEARHFVSQKRESRLPRFPQLDEVPRMIEAAKLLPYDSPVKERNIAIVEFLASTGCRNDEICKLKIKDFTTDRHSAIVTGKGNKERRVFICNVARDALLHYWTARGFADTNHPAFARHDKGNGKKINGLTTKTIRKIVDEVSKVAGIETFTPHYFRHAFAIKMLRETGNLALVQDLLGHVSPGATRVYAKIYPEDLEQAHRMVYG